MTRSLRCRDCRYWKASAKAGKVKEYSPGRYPVPRVIVCIHTKEPVGRMDACPDWECVPINPTCYNCIHLDLDGGRAHLYGYGFCTLHNLDKWVNVRIKRTSCRYREFRVTNHENQHIKQKDRKEL